MANRASSSRAARWCARVACDWGRLLPSLALFSSFLLLGVFVSALGPAVPSLSRTVGVPEVSFGTAFSLRGLGYLLGSWCSSVRLWAKRDTRVHQALNNRMNRLGAATGGIGLFSLALGTAEKLSWVCVWCFCQGFCGGAIDAIANSAISVVHGADVAPWMQGLHFSFSAGALFTPAAIGQFGYRAVFLTFGLLAMPSALACCLAGGEGSPCCEQGVERGKHRLLRESDEYLDPTCGGDVELSRFVREGGAENTEEQRNTIAAGRHADEAGAASVREEHDCKGIAPASTPEHDGDLSLPPASAVGLAAAQEARGGKEGEEEEEHKRLNASVSGGFMQRPEQPDEAEAIPPQEDTHGNMAPFPLVALLALFLFLYVGAEVGFGAWIAVVVLRDDLAEEAGAALMASLFWGGITVGRLLAVPLAVRFSAGFLVRANLFGGLLSSMLLLAVGRDGIVWAAVGAAVFGLFMASTFPLAMSLLPSAGYVVSDKNSSSMVIGGALGEMVVPAFISALLGPSDGGQPAALYSVCLAISGLLVVVYGAWCSFLSAVERRSGKGEGGP